MAGGKKLKKIRSKFLDPALLKGSMARNESYDLEVKDVYRIHKENVGN
jgi:hypothetical protein